MMLLAVAVCLLLALSTLIWSVHQLRRDVAALRASTGVAPSQPVAPGTQQTLTMSAYYPVDPVPRYGYGKPDLAPLEALFRAGKARYGETLDRFLPLLPDLREIERNLQPHLPEEPAWINDFLPGLDALVLYGFVATGQPRLYLEIGSGNSTKFVARAKRRHSPHTRIVSIDPHPRAEIDQLCDRIIRKPLEQVGSDEFRHLAAGDVLFFDGSHRVFQNSDVTVFFLEVLPALAPGVLVQIHDIFLPADYPPAWAERYYSEQYLVALLLLFGQRDFEVVLPNAYVTTHTDLTGRFGALFDSTSMQGVERHGNSLWLRRL